MPATGPVLSGELRRRGTMGPRVKPAGDDWRGGRADKAPPAPRPDAPCTQIVIPAKRPPGARLAGVTAREAAQPAHRPPRKRSDKRPGGNEGGRTGRYRGVPYP